MGSFQKGKLMQMQYTVQQSGRPALRSGVVVGIALGIIHSVVTIVMTQMNGLSTSIVGGPSGLPTITVVLYLLTPLVWIIGFLGAGAWAGRETGRISAGVLAGLFAGTFGGIIAGVGQVIATALATSQQNLNGSNSSLILFSGFAAVFYVMVLALGAGAGFGVLGGLIGQSMSRVRPAPQPIYAQPPVPYTYVPVPPSQVPLPPRESPEMRRMPEQ